MRLLFSLSLILAFLAPLSAADITVTSEAGDGSSGTLREAIANANPGDRILFASNISTIIVAFLGELDVDKDLTIDASSRPNGVTITGGDINRVFHVESGATVELINLTIQNGKSDDGADAPSSGRGGDGENGGGIFNEGDLTIRECRVINNETGKGGNAAADLGGDGGRGGGIYSNDTLTVIDSVISGNVTGNGGVSSDLPSGPTQRIGGAGGNGGGIASPSGTLSILRSTIEENTTGDGNFGTREGGEGGLGGGIFLSNETTTIDQSTIANNETGIGGNSSATYDFDGGQGGNGGGIAIIGGNPDTEIKNSTISGNTTGGGGIQGDAQDADPGLGGHGGGIYTRGAVSSLATLNLLQVTIYGNSTGRGAPINAEGGSGGGIFLGDDDSFFDRPVALTIENTIVAMNTVATNGTSADIAFDDGLVFPEELNFIGDNTSVETEFPAGPFAGTSGSPLDPGLGALGSNGGSTETHAPSVASPVVDPAGGSTASTEPTDQRGFARRSGSSIDIGAVEFLFSAPAISAPSRVRARRNRAKFAVAVGSPVATQLSARANAKARASVQGGGGSFQVSVRKITRKKTRVQLIALDTKGGSAQAQSIIQLKKKR